MSCESFSITLPAWYKDFVAQQNFGELTNDETKLSFAVELSKLNVQNRSGGPFGAAIFCNKTHKLLAAGVNLVTPQTTSLAHAECVSIGIAQQKTHTHDLSSGGADYSLYCSAQPCIMCFGAIWWSGIRRVICAAKASDVEELTGFLKVRYRTTGRPYSNRDRLCQMLRFCGVIRSCAKMPAQFSKNTKTRAPLFIMPALN